MRNDFFNVQFFRKSDAQLLLLITETINIVRYADFKHVFMGKGPKIVNLARF